MQDIIARAIELAQDTIAKQEQEPARLVGWYVCGHSRHTITISIGIETGPMQAFKILVEINLKTSEIELV